MALTPWSTLANLVKTKVQNVLLCVKGVGVDEVYPLEADPATGGLPVTFSADKDYGVVGANTLRTAAQIGNATGAADFGSGAAGAQTLRSVLATRHEDPTTPLSVRLSDGTNLYDGASETTLSAAATSLSNIDTTTAAISGQLPTALGQTTLAASLSVAVASDQWLLDFGAAAGALRVAAQIGNAAGALDTDAGNVTAQTLRVQPSDDAIIAILSSNYSPYGEGFGGGPGPGTVMLSTAAHIGNATGACSFDSGASTAQTLRAVLATRHEAAATPVAVRLSDGASFAAPATSGRSKVDLIRNDYTGTPVTTAAYVQILAATAAEINKLWVFDSSGSALVLATGAAAAEVDQFYIPPGGLDAPMELKIPAGTRLSVKAVDTNATVGQLLISAMS